MTPDANLAVAMQSLVQLIDVEAASKVRTVVEDALHAARQEALEEAAKIAEGFSQERGIAMANHMAIDRSDVGDRLVWGHREARVSCNQIASAIRERAEE